MIGNKHERYFITVQYADKSKIFKIIFNMGRLRSENYCVRNLYTYINKTLKINYEYKEKSRDTLIC